MNSGKCQKETASFILLVYFLAIYNYIIIIKFSFNNDTSSLNEMWKKLLLVCFFVWIYYIELLKNINPLNPFCQPNKGAKLKYKNSMFFSLNYSIIWLLNKITFYSHILLLQPLTPLYELSKLFVILLRQFNPINFTSNKRSFASELIISQIGRSVSNPCFFTLVLKHMLQRVLRNRVMRR